MFSSTYASSRALACSTLEARSPSLKGSGFVQPLAPHEHWHVDVSYINVPGLSSFSARCSTVARAPSFTGSCARP